MPKKYRPSPDGAQTSQAKPSTRGGATPTGQGAPQPPPQARARPPEDEFADRPDIQFARDFDPDLTSALYQEVGLELESEFEAELEQRLIDEANAEPWAASIMRQSWSAQPRLGNLEYDPDRFRVTPDAFAAMQISDPLEAMLAAQAFAIHSNVLHVLRQATRAKSLNLHPEIALRYFTMATKLAAAYAKLMETLKRYRMKGEQKVSVRYERFDRGTQSRAKVSRSKRERITVSGPGAGVADFAKAPEKDPVRAAGETGLG